MCKTLTTIGCIIIGAGLLDWYDLWHLVIGLPLLVGGMLSCLWLWQRLWPGDEEEANETRDDIGGAWSQSHCGYAVWGAYRGSACGGVRCGLTDGSCSGLAGAGLLRPLREVSILAEGHVYARSIEVVEVQLQQPLGATCRRALQEHKARAFLGLAGQRQGKERLDMLLQARKAAEDIPLYDLCR
jgi:hypothetical protein